jgi:hypothetical protein
MSETMQMWVEVSFNVLYLAAIWGLVIAMAHRLHHLLPEKRPLAHLFMVAFALLALGDTGHVGFRVLAYALGGLGTRVTIFGAETGLVGLGALSTAVTITFFYVVIAMIWRKRFEKPYGWFGYLLFVAAAMRLVLMIFPQNEWNSPVPPSAWSIYRNLPLIIQGLGAAYLILSDAIASKDRLFQWVGVMILISYAFYAPVILFIRAVPPIGMLMIPKTLAYVGIAVLAYGGLFRLSAMRNEVTA